MTQDSRQKNIEAFPSRPSREITIAGIRYRYHIGHCNVVCYSERGDKLVAKVWTVKGVTPSVWERGQHKKTDDGALKPADVTRWILSEEAKDAIASIRRRVK